MALLALLSGSTKSLCPKSPSTEKPLATKLLMTAALAGNCTLSQRGWSGQLGDQFDGENLFDIHDLIQIHHGRPSSRTLSLTFSPEGSSHGLHHLVLYGQTEEHGLLVARIGHLSGSLDSLQEAGFGSAFGLSASRALNSSAVCLENFPDAKWGNSYLVTKAAAINEKAASRNAMCAAMEHGQLGSGRLADVEGLPRMVGMGCCAVQVSPTCTVPLFITVSEQMQPFADDPETTKSLSLAPQCQQMVWGPLQCHLARLITSLVTFEQLTESGECHRGAL